MLASTKEGTEELVLMVNEFYELLYDEIIPRLFRLLFDLDESQQTEEHEVELINRPRRSSLIRSRLPSAWSTKSSNRAMLTLVITAC